MPKKNYSSNDGMLCHVKRLQLLGRACVSQSLRRASTRSPQVPCSFVDLGTLPYAEVWDQQRNLVAARGEFAKLSLPPSACGDVPGEKDVVLMVTHDPPVYTLGKGSTTANLRFSGFDHIAAERAGSKSRRGPVEGLCPPGGAEVFRVERGGVSVSRSSTAA